MTVVQCRSLHTSGSLISAGGDVSTTLECRGAWKVVKGIFRVMECAFPATSFEKS